ncbi:MAG: cupin domain-containing protein [Candidatus Gastranaerophilales bacterium]|nr:cupin domain-containing protein [Candidatus Gastranaerophilales bacterium]
MFYNKLKIEDLVQNETDKIDKKVLLENNESKLTAIAIKKDEMLTQHQSDTDACAYVYDGEVEFHFEAEKFTLKKGELILFKKHDMHSVHANKDSKLLVIRI